MQLVVALALTCVTVLIHAVGTTAAIVRFGRNWQRKKANPGRWTGGAMIVRIVSTLLLLHLIETCTWAAFYVAADILPDLETAVYFSLTSYTTVGYGDIVLRIPWRLLGPLEGAVGILMFGWSTGIMVAAISRIHRELSMPYSQQDRDARETRPR